MKANQRTLLSCAVSGVLGISGTAALAQESTGRTTSVLEEVVVTAQKRSQSLQDVAVAVSAFTSEARDLIGITTIADLTDFTPGLSYATTLDRMSLRGVGRLTNNYGSDPGIATYSDGFYTASNVEAGKRPIHTERIEVLRGPQGTLYGRNSIGGALNVISRRPTETWEGEVRAVAGNYDTQIFDGSLSGPITDWLRFKVSGSSGGQGEGFFRDEDGGPSEGNVGDDLYAEGQLEFNIGDAFEGWFKYGHSEWNQRRRSLVQISQQDISPRYFGGLFPTTTYNGPQTASASPAERDARHASIYDDRALAARSPALQYGYAVRDQPRQRAHLYARVDLAHGLRRREVCRRLPGLHVHAGIRFRRHLAPGSVHGAGRRRPQRRRADPARDSVHDLPAGPGVLSGGQGVLQQRDQSDLDPRWPVPVDPGSLSVSRAGFPVRGRQRAESGRNSISRAPPRHPPRRSSVRRIPTGSCRTPARGSMPMRTRRSLRSTTPSATTGRRRSVSATRRTTRTPRNSVRERCTASRRASRKRRLLRR